eukprot:scaffold49388_cov28-Tisochrysis_lutea.AAC.2
MDVEKELANPPLGTRQRVRLLRRNPRGFDFPLHGLQQVGPRMTVGHRRVMACCGLTGCERPRPMWKLKSWTIQRSSARWNVQLRRE